MGLTDFRLEMDDGRSVFISQIDSVLDEDTAKPIPINDAILNNYFQEATKKPWWKFW